MANAFLRVCSDYGRQREKDVYIRERRDKPILFYLAMELLEKQRTFKDTPVPCLTSAGTIFDTIERASKCAARSSEDDKQPGHLM